MLFNSLTNKIAGNSAILWVIFQVLTINRTKSQQKNNYFIHYFTHHINMLYLDIFEFCKKLYIFNREKKS